MDRYQFTKQEQTVLESLRQPFAIYQFINKRVVTLVLSDGFCDLFGYEDRELAYYDMDRDMYKYAHPDDVARIADAAFRFATEGGSYDVVYRNKKKNGSDYHIIHAAGSHVYTESGVRLAHVWYTDEGACIDDPDDRDITLNQTLNHTLHEESVLKASHYDYLTGLPSMTYFFELAEAGKTAIEKEGHRAVLLYFDLSGMKFYNAKYGFSEGDKLLQSFARLLIRHFSSENCCHIGGDHFAAFTKEDGLEDILLELFEECKNLNDGDSLPVRVGIYPAQVNDVPASTACDRAKFACDILRNKAGSAFNYYDEKLRAEEEHRQYIRSSLDDAIKEGWIRVYYQPIVRTVNGHVCDEEALARWIDPDRGFLSPAAFIPTLEEYGLIYKLDLYVLEQILEKINRMLSLGFDLVPHSLNLSRSDFDACDIVEEIRMRVDASGIKREMITIEITESVIGSDFDFMKEQVRRFRDLGFPVWMDDFGSGYSSMDVLQTIQFDLIKFDMSFMQRLDEGDNGKIILTELMKMANALGVDTVCEGVETEDQVRFLREIGCSKLQGFYYCKPIPLSQILERYEKGIQIGYENPEESAYYEVVGRVNLYDFAVIANKDDSEFQHFFNTLPMSIIEVNGPYTRFIRSNPSYRDFFKHYFGLDLSFEGTAFSKYSDAFMYNVVRTCCELGNRSFYDEKMPDGSVIHSFARRIGTNPVNGNIAVAIVVLSITDPNEGASYAEIARALASDYYNMYYIDLDTEQFIEYSSPVGGQEMAEERHGEEFFTLSRQDTMTRIYEEDREKFLTAFTKENIIKELDDQGAFTMTYRLIDSGLPLYANMKITRMQKNSNRIIMGVSIVDSQMKQKAESDKLLREETAYARIMALSGDYLSLYTIEPDTGSYIECNATSEYESLGLAKTGSDFFGQCIINGKKAIYEEDLPMYLTQLTRENVLRQISENNAFTLQYRLMINGVPKPVILKIVPVRESSGIKLIAGVRFWRERQ